MIRGWTARFCSFLAATVVIAPSFAEGATYYVATTGNNANDGSSGNPWRTLQFAADHIQAGDTVVVRAGSYAGFNGAVSGTPSNRITFTGEPGATIDTPVNVGNTIGINTSGRQYITIEGFTFRPQANGPEWYSCIRMGGTPSNWVKGNVIRNNRCEMRKVDSSPTPDKYGIYTSWNDGLLVEGNTVSGTYNTGIYAANSAKNYTIRANHLFDLGGNGIHNNGDLSAGSPGINVNATIEGNVIHNVGFGAGGQAISCDGVQDSRIRNNLIYDAHAKGISLYATNAAEGCKRVIVSSNTVLLLAGGYVPMRITEYSSANTIVNNIFLSATAHKAWIDIEEPSADGMVSDYNVTTGIEMVGGSIRNDWQSTYGFDTHSRESVAAALFLNPGASDYHPKANSPAIDAGTSTGAPSIDLDGAARPQGAAFDAGCYEAAGADLIPPAIVVRAPAANGIGVSRQANVTARFNEQIQPGTLSFTLKDGANNSVSATVSYSSLTAEATLDPQSALAPLTVYTATITGATDLSGNVMTSTSWSFTTGGTAGGSDADGDGLSNADEGARGTDPSQFDTDGDAIGDGQEVLDGTNPLDRGSVLVRRGVDAAGGVVPLCADWNSFLGLWNIKEHLNTAGDPLAVLSSRQNAAGVEQTSTGFEIAAGAQFDLLVHDLGQGPDQYGQICATGSFAGALDGTMMFYKPGSLQPGEQFEFALGMQLGNERTREQVTPFNTYDPENEGKLVANWVSIANTGSETAGGTLFVHRIDGSVLSSERVMLSAGERRDFSGHAAGLSQVGMARFRPDSNSSKFRMRNIRYLYDNFALAPHFSSAVSIDGLVGSGELLAGAIDTRGQWGIVEVSNSSAAPSTVTVRLYDSGGTLQHERALPLGAYATEHVVANELLPSQLGIVTVKGSHPESTVAVVMHYRWNGAGRLGFLHGAPAREAIGRTLSGSFNSYLGQGSHAILVNPTAQPQSASITLRKGSGELFVNGERVTVPAHGVLEYDVGLRVPTDVYGVITVVPDAKNSLVAESLRLRTTEYVVRTAIRQ